MLPGLHVISSVTTGDFVNFLESLISHLLTGEYTRCALLGSSSPLLFVINEVCMRKECVSGQVLHKCSYYSFVTMATKGHLSDNRTSN